MRQRVFGKIGKYINVAATRIFADVQVSTPEESQVSKGAQTRDSEYVPPSWLCAPWRRHVAGPPERLSSRVWDSGMP